MLHIILLSYKRKLNITDIQEVNNFFNTALTFVLKLSSCINTNQHEALPLTNRGHARQSCQVNV